MFFGVFSLFLRTYFSEMNHKTTTLSISLMPVNVGGNGLNSMVCLFHEIIIETITGSVFIPDKLYSLPPPLLIVNKHHQDYFKSSILSILHPRFTDDYTIFFSFI